MLRHAQVRDQSKIVNGMSLKSYMFLSTFHLNGFLTFLENNLLKVLFINSSFNISLTTFFFHLGAYIANVS